jgi:hypothetical protein
MKWLEQQEGNVIVEFIGIIVALLIPISVIANASLMVANAYLTTDIAARNAARAFVVSSSDASGRRAVNAAAQLAARDFNASDSAVVTNVLCTHNPCLSPGGYVTVRIDKNVNLNLPRVFGPRTVVVTSHHTLVVDELRAP